MKTIRWGIIGVGDVCEVKSGPAFQKAPGSELVAVMRRDGAKAEDFARRHGVANWSSVASDLLESEQIDAIYIATPPNAHVDYAIQALSAGKHVYLEKPMARNAKEARKILQAAEKSSHKLVVAHYRRRLPLYQQIKEILANEELGKARYVSLQTIQPENDPLIAASEDYWRVQPEISGGGIFHDLSPHQLDLILYFFGDPLSISGTASRRMPNARCDDCVAGQMSFFGDVVFQGYWDFASQDGTIVDACEIKCDHGALRFSFFRSPKLEIVRSGNMETVEFLPPVHIQQPMIEAVNAYFRGEAENPCHAATGVKVMEMIDSLSGSA
jgi:1,5-anhydro-D-fructose reductase (1,5-anhydro-D-mannitol-forming)